MVGVTGSGVTGIIETLDDLLRQPDGKRLSIREALGLFGYRAVWIAALNGHVKDISRKPKLHGYPPRIFISYKWQDDAHGRWVRSVTDAFRDIGYEVLLDQYDCTVKDHMDVPRYVSLVAESHYIVMIVTAEYLEMGTWVFDESNMAANLSEQGITRNIALVRDVPSNMPNPAATLIGRFGCDPTDLHFMGSISDPYSFIQRTFPIDGPRYDAEQKRRLMALRDESAALLDSGQFRTAAEMIDASPDLAESIEVRTLIALIYAKASENKQPALDTARALIDSHAINSFTRLQLAEVFRCCGQHREALQAVSPLRGKNQFASNAAYFYGNLLDDLGAYEAALNHLEYCRLMLGDQPHLLNDLGVVHKNNSDLRQAERCFRRALELLPDDLNAQANLAAVLMDMHRDVEANEIVARGRARFTNFAESVKAQRSKAERDLGKRPSADRIGYICGRCRSSFQIASYRQRLCGDCGVVYDAGQPHCPCCGSDGFVPVEVSDEIRVRCPVCCIGNITRSTSTGTSTLPTTSVTLWRARLRSSPWQKSPRRDS